MKHHSKVIAEYERKTVAHETNGIDIVRRPFHDGALRCVLCLGSDPASDHEWCPAARSLLCEDCCAALLHGDITRLFSIAAHSGRIVTFDDLFRTCASCPRIAHHARQDLLDEADEDDTPPC